MNRRLLSIAAVSLVLGGCQTWGPTWSEVTGQRYTRTTMFRMPATLERVDSQGSFVSIPAKIEPGERRIVVSANSPQPRPGGGDLRVLMLNAQPCERYYINAQFRNPFDPDFEPVIDFVEQIAGCQMPTAAAAPKTAAK